MKAPARLKTAWFRLLGKDPEAVVVSFWSGPDDLAARMLEQVRDLVPGRRHFVVSLEPRDVPGAQVVVARRMGELRRAFRDLRVGLAPVLFAGGPHALRGMAWRLAPLKILAFNGQLERHHLRLRNWIASWLFARGVPFDRIFLRPWSRTLHFGIARVIEGRAPVEGRSRIGALTPYFPYPMSHGGAVRMYHLLRETAREFDVTLFSFTENESEEDYRALLPLCSKIVLVRKPRYRKPRWATVRPPEVLEFESPAMRRALREHPVDLLQVEYTHLARYGGGVLVEHDITFDLYRQVWLKERTFSARWDYWRWRWFETRAASRFRRVTVMSAKDAPLVGAAAAVIENGVDLERFAPQPESAGLNLLFIGSFRHFPNLAAFRFFTLEVWPALAEQFRDMTLTVVGGPDHERYMGPAPRDPRIHVHGFVRDVRPLYHAANVVLAPNTVSAGTNLKVIEALAMERAVVSTPCACAGLGLEHLSNVWIAEGAGAFLEGVARLASGESLRRRLARAGRIHAERHFDWKALGEKQRALYRELLTAATIG